jgi:hypothetical protein
VIARRLCEKSENGGTGNGEDGDTHLGTSTRGDWGSWLRGWDNWDGGVLWWLGNTGSSWEDREGRLGWLSDWWALRGAWADWLYGCWALRGAWADWLGLLWLGAASSGRDGTSSGRARGGSPGGGQVDGSGWDRDVRSLGPSGARGNLGTAGSDGDDLGLVDNGTRVGKSNTSENGSRNSGDGRELHFDFG